MAYDYDAAKKYFSGLLANAPAKETVWNSLTDNRVASAVGPHFSKVYNSISGQVKTHSYVVGGAGLIISLVLINILFSGSGKPPAK